MIRRSHHRVVSEDHFHRHLDLPMLPSKLPHYPRNLPPDLSLALFRNKAAVDKNLESIRNNIPLKTPLHGIDVQSRSHLPSPPDRLRIDSRSSLADLFSQLLQILNQGHSIFDGVDACPSASRMSRLSMHCNQVFSVPETRDMQCLNPTICRETIIHILRNHVLVNKIIHTAIPAHLLISGKRRSNPPAELRASLNKRFHRKYLAGVRPFHVSSTSPIDLAILDHRLTRIMRPSRWISRDHINMPIEKDPRSLTLTFESGIGVGPRTLQADLGTHLQAHRRFRNEAHRRRDTQVLELTGQDLGYPRIVQPRRNSSIYVNQSTGKINKILLVSINPSINLLDDSLRGQEPSNGSQRFMLIVLSIANRHWPI